MYGKIKSLKKKVKHKEHRKEDTKKFHILKGPTSKPGPRGRTPGFKEAARPARVSRTPSGGGLDGEEGCRRRCVRVSWRRTPASLTSPPPRRNKKEKHRDNEHTFPRRSASVSRVSGWVYARVSRWEQPRLGGRAVAQYKGFLCRRKCRGCSSREARLVSFKSPTPRARLSLRILRTRTKKIIANAIFHYVHEGYLRLAIKVWDFVFFFLRWGWTTTTVACRGERNRETWLLCGVS